MTMFKFTALCGVAAFALAATAGNAQATRTWVSGVGDDVNPCSRTAPCKTFAGAISKTAAGGEINCLDPGGFGAVTIIKSMTISCPYTEGGALAGGNGVVVNLPTATDVVYLRGLDIFGVNPPTNGVRFIAQGTLHIEDSVIRRFNAANSTGVSFAPSGAGQLFISNTTIAENGNAATGGGILIQPTGAGGNARVTLRNVRMMNNANGGLRIDTTGNTGTGVRVSVDSTSIIGSPVGLSAVQPAGQASITVQLIDSTLSNNTTFGIIASGATTRVRVGGSTIFNNGTAATQIGGAIINVYGDNYVNGNATSDGTFTLPAIPPT